MNTPALLAPFFRAAARSNLCRAGALAIALATLPSAAWGTNPAQEVTCREVDEVIPTYLSGPPSADPMFYFGGQSQGAEGRIYPYPLYNNLTNQKADKTYHLVYLENQYVKIAIAPELGGRLLSAVDKTNGYDFVYHQHVIKPALIGLIGAWISGGIEWNIPHHHRASTFIPVQYRTVKNADGSWTVWVGELEIRHRMRWAVGYTLSPGSSVLTCSVRIVNRTPLAQSMLCFANVAVNADKDYQIIFPPSTQFVAHHLKRQFTTWPIATTPYGGVDWNGVDASWYKNHTAANSMFAWNSPEDFFAGYDHGRQAGTMSVADHHIVPGKKFWTWGNGPHGRMWDSILTDTDGPYLELMVGAYSDNQPDYSWMQPFETRSFEMSWYPFRDIGGVKNANLEAAVNLDVKDGSAHLGFSTTRAHTGARAQLAVAGKLLLDEPIDIGPAAAFTRQIVLPAGTGASDVRATLVADGRELVSYAPITLTAEPMPAVVTPPVAPKDIASDEELDLTGQRIDQFHDPLHEAEPYWEEALRRDPGDTNAHVNIGLGDLRAARYAEAEAHFRRALDRLTAKYTSPKDVEPLYYLGLALRGEGRDADAYDAFYKAAWSQEWRAPAYYSLAEISSSRGDYPKALKFVDQALQANALNLRAYGLKAALLRHLGRSPEAKVLLEEAAALTDPLDVRLMAEQWLADPSPKAAALLFGMLDSHIAAAQELAADYGNAGLWKDGLAVLSAAVDRRGGSSRSPIVLYYAADFAQRSGDEAATAAFRRAAAALPPDYVFPFQAELIPVLRRAIADNPSDARAPYYLGNLLFDWQPAEAKAFWEKSSQLDPSFAVVWRNLAQAFAHSGDSDGRARAIEALEKAVSLSDRYPAHFSELDALYARAGAPVQKRLDLLESHQAAIVNDDESLARLITLKTFARKSDEAIALLQAHTFNIWEGGTQFDTGGMWIDAHLSRGRGRLAAGNADAALADFQAALAFPANLRALPWEGVGSRTIEVGFWTGAAYQALGQSDKANEAWQAAAAAAVPHSLRRNDANASFDRSVQQYYQAMAMQRLGQAEAARKLFASLVEAGAAKDDDAGAAVGSRTGLSPRNRAADAHFLSGLGHDGLGEKAQAHSEFEAALASTPDDLEAELAIEEDKP
jgi:tetratricopeptide (TPR) repeat protein